MNHKQEYSQDRMEKMKEYIRLYHEKGRPIQYEIIVDGVKAVRRTDDPDEFMLYENFMDQETKKVELVVFQGSSQHNDRYIYSLTEEPPKVEIGLSGIEIETRIAKKLEEEKRNWQFELLQKENAELKAEIEELEDEISKLEKVNTDMEAKQSPLNGILGEVGSSFIESFLKRNPQVLSKIPGGEALAGILEADNSKPALVEPDTDVSFKPVGGTGAERSEEDQAAITFVGQLKESFSKEQFDQVCSILQIFTEDTSLITKTLNQLKKEANEEA